MWPMRCSSHTAAQGALPHGVAGMCGFLSTNDCNQQRGIGKTSAMCPRLGGDLIAAAPRVRPPTREDGPVHEAKTE